MDVEKLRALAAYLGNPPNGGNHYAGSQYSIDRMKEGASAILALAEERDRLRQALQDIKYEAVRENGKWIHLKRAIHVAARRALGKDQAD